MPVVNLTKAEVKEKTKEKKEKRRTEQRKRQVAKCQSRATPQLAAHRNRHNAVNWQRDHRPALLFSHI